MCFTIVCPVCDFVTEVKVKYDTSEVPQHCPMCGSDADPEYDEDDLEDDD